jgi:hypothetical protein
MSNQTNERLQYLQSYFNNQKVKIEVLAQSSHTSKGTIIYRFNGRRNNYDFKDGIAFVEKKDVHLFQHQHYVIHTNEKDGN